MQWYYVDNNQQAGPVQETDFPPLIQAGKLRAETLVWREGMTNWEPFRNVCPPEYASALGTARPGATAATGNEAVCVECGGVFNKDDMIPHGNVHICANCKPVFMQKLAEGVQINTGALNYAPIGTRFGAAVLDGIILWVVSFVLQFTAGFLVGSVASGTAQGILGLILMFAQLAIGLSYEVFMIGKYGATLGKMACKIKVVTPDGGRVSYLRALGRYFAKMLSGFICMIGYIMAFFDKEEKRALHDRMCDTRVVLK